MIPFLLLLWGLLLPQPSCAQTPDAPAIVVPEAAPENHPAATPAATMDQAKLSVLQQRAGKAGAVFATVTDPVLRQRVGTLIEYYQAAFAQSDINRMQELLRQIERALKIPPDAPPKQSQKDGKDIFDRFYGRRPGWSFGMVNTNFDNNKKEMAGGMDADTRYVPNQTRADADFYPNMVTDRMMVRRDAPVWQQLGLAFNQVMGKGVNITPIVPNPGFEHGLVRDGNTINLVSNQLFRASRGPDTPKRSLLVTWILPPDWQPDQPHALLMIFPPMGQSNNMALFDDPALKNWVVLMEALKASTSKRLAIMLVNSGGLTASGLQPDLEYPLLEAVRFGVASLGIDPQRIAMMGEGRGGYAAMRMAGMLSQIASPGAKLAIRGVFVGEAGTVHEELSVHPTFAPFDLQNRRAENADDTVRRLVGVPSLQELAALAPDRALAGLKPTMPMVFFWHGNIWNPALLPFSVARLMTVVQRLPNSLSQFLVDHSDTLNRHGDQRYRMAVACLVALSDHQNCTLDETGLIHADSQGMQMPIMLRAPAFALMRQPVDVEIMAAAGTPITIVAAGSSQVRRTLPEQIIPDRGVLRLTLPASTGEGRMVVEVFSQQQMLGKVTFPVVGAVPDLSLPGARTEIFSPAIMPHMVTGW